MADFSIKDILYFDFDKAASIYSQFHGGLRESISITEGKTKGQALGAKLGIPSVFEANAGMDFSNATSIIESKVLHHDLLNTVEQELSKLELVVNLNTKLDTTISSPEDIRTVISNKPYIVASGWSFIEDYNHISAQIQVFNKVVEFASRCGTETIKKSADYVKIQSELDDKRKEISGMTDRNQKAVAKNQINAIENNLKEMLSPKVGQLDDWLIEGILQFIKTFMPNRINFRIYPFVSCPSFQIICNLKRSCFVDQDLEHLLYGYTDRPTVPLTVFGLITSIPPKETQKFDPLSEFETTTPLNGKLIFEKAFRGVFGATNELEDWMRYSRYPNISVHPLAVFRQFRTNK